MSALGKKVNPRRLPLWGTILTCFAVISLIGFLLAKFACDEKWFPITSYLVVAAVLAVAGCIAYHQLTTIQGTQRASVLTSLDNIWMGYDMQECRIAFLDFEDRIESEKGNRKYETFVKEALENMRTKDKNNYRKLTRMLEFFEGVGYFCKVNYILLGDAEGLYGPAIRTNSKVFRPHIAELQQKANDTSIYDNFLWLSDKLG
jgi:uncharacterized membrane protein YeiB